MTERRPIYISRDQNLDPSVLAEFKAGDTLGVEFGGTGGTSVAALSALLNLSSFGSGGVTDHGALTGLGDNDHPQYVLSATNSTLSSLVTTNQTNLEGVSSTVFDNSGAWATDTDTTDHGSFTGLSDDDHPQYVLSATNVALSSLASTADSVATATSSTVFDNSSTWGQDYVLADGSNPVTGGLNVSGSLKSATSVSLASEYDNGTSGTNININWNNGNYQTVTMSATTTFTFTDPTYGVASLILRLVQSGASNVTTLPTIKWPRGSAPSISTVSGAQDIITLYYNGTSYYGNFGGAFA